MPSILPPVFLPFAFPAPTSCLWCVCQQHSCLEQSAWADICRTASLIWSATRSIRVTKSSIRQSRHRGRRFLCVFRLYASLSLIKILIAHSGLHTRVFQLFVGSMSGASVCGPCCTTRLALSHVCLIKLCLRLAGAESRGECWFYQAVRQLQWCADDFKGGFSDS